MSDAPPPPPPPPAPAPFVATSTPALGSGMLSEISNFNRKEMSHAETKDMSGPRTSNFLFSF